MTSQSSVPRQSIWTLFKQQRLPAWQPILTPLNSALCLFAIAILCIPLSIALFHANAAAVDITHRYDNVQPCSFGHSSKGAFRYAATPTEAWQSGCVKDIRFEISRPLKAPVYLYYGLDNFYQNHRRFTNSKSDAQLAGRHATVKSIASLTSPLTYPGEIRHEGKRTITIDGKPFAFRDVVYAPAGLIPWSMFNDTFELYRLEGPDAEASMRLICNGSAFSRFTNNKLEGAGQCHKKGIAWTSDAENKYKKPHFPPADSPHPVWSAPRSAYDAQDGDAGPEPPSEARSDNAFFNNGWYVNEPGHRVPVTTDEDLMVWSRIASLPKFRKLYRVIDEDLKPGTYVMRIGEHFDVASLDGQKSFSLATLSWLGGNNRFMAWMYFVMGAICAASGAAFLCIHRWYGDRALRAVATLLKAE